MKDKSLKLLFVAEETANLEHQVEVTDVSWWDKAHYALLILLNRRIRIIGKGKLTVSESSTL